MPVTLDKTPRDLTVLIVDGTVHGIVLTPTTEEGRTDLAIDAFALCLDTFEVTAVDRYEAHMRAVAAYDRAVAIEDYMDRIGVNYGTARAVYRDCRTWARALTPKGRASWLTNGLKEYVPLKHFALIEAMREFGEPTV